MPRRDTLHRIIVANVFPGETLHKGPMNRVQTVQRAFVVSAVVNRLPLRAHKEKNAPRAGPRAFRVRCREAEGFLSSATDERRDRFLVNNRIQPIRGVRREKESEAMP